jgi:hypothetical protein
MSGSGAVSSVKKKAESTVGNFKAGLLNPIGGAAQAIKDVKKKPLTAIGKTLVPVGGGQQIGEGATKLAVTEAQEQENKQRQEAAAELASQTSQGTSAIASANEVSRVLASNPNAQVSGSVAAGDARSGLFSSLMEGIEKRRAQILQSKRTPGRKSTILTR